MKTSLDWVSLGIPYFQNPWVHPQATVMGMVEFGASCSVWPGVVLRADMNRIQLGDAINIQDNTTLHTDSQTSISIGDFTLVGHNAMLHGCKIGRACLIGIGSVILDGAEIGDGSQITAGCLIRGGKKIPPKSLVVSKGGEIVIYPGKAKPELTIAGSIEYIHLAIRAQNNQFQPFTPDEEARFVSWGKEIWSKIAPRQLFSDDK